VLRPLRTITATARRISATNLHERLALEGPADELKQLGDTVDDLLSRLEHAFQSQRQFVANVSHELRSPLTRLRLLAEIAAGDTQASVDSLQSAFRRVIVAAQSQDDLIEGLLTLAKGQRGLSRTEPVDLELLAREVIDNLATESTDRVTVHRDGLQPAMIRGGDPRLVERLIANLMDNATRYNVDGGHAYIATGADRESATLIVSNDGPCVPRSQIERLFAPFERMEEGRGHHTAGHGLGLAVVKAIADAHGATVSADPRREGGLRVQVNFPHRAPASNG
jgi:signal transduction histidine kinase